MQADIIENRTFNEIAIGESASLTRTLTKDDIALFAVMSGDVNPAHLDQGYAEASALAAPDAGDLAFAEGRSDPSRSGRDCRRMMAIEDAAR